MCVRWTCPQDAWWWTGIPNSDVAGQRDLRNADHAQQRELLQVETWNPRDYATDRHRSVDSSSYGGGPGMVMMIEPLRTALVAMREAAPEPVHLVYLSPQGARLTQGRVEALAKLPRIGLLCGRYEGVDERLLAHEVDEELSIGDYVLSDRKSTRLNSSHHSISY